MKTVTNPGSEVGGDPKRHAPTVRLEDLERVLASETSDALVVISRLDREGRYTYVSPRVEHITGVPAAAFLGKSLPIPGVDPQVAVQLIRARAEVYHTLKTSHIELTYPTACGVHYFRTAIVPEHDDQDSVQSILTVSTDITTEKLLTETLMYLGQQIAFDLGGMALWDWSTSEETNYWSPQLAELFGFGAEDKWHATQDWVDRIHPEDRHSVLACLNDAMRSQAVFDSEYRIIVPGRGVRCLQALGKVTNKNAHGLTRFIGVVRDVTDTKSAEFLEGGDVRKLVPAFILLGRILAWRCDACDKLFVNTLEEAEGATAPSRWINQFHRHHCAETPALGLREAGAQRLPVSK